MACCPKDALGKLGTGGYVNKGKVEKVDDLELYVVGTGPKCVIWNYDIFGFDSGRTRQTADLFAEAGYLVIMPDFYRGTWRDPSDPAATDVVQFIRDQTNWDKLKKEVDNIVLPFAKSKGAKSFGSLGTCWGSYMVMRLSSYDQFAAGASWHPSHSPIGGLLGEDEKQLLSSIKCPQLFMPAGGDAESCKKGGLAEQVLGDKLTITEFPDMQHGWTVRGDMSDPAISRDVNKVVMETLDFFAKHL